MREELLNEEETLKMLKVNKAQLENYVREGKLSPLYQESVRKFKLSDVSKIIGETLVPPMETTPPEITPPLEEEPPLIKTSEYTGPERRKEEGSTRIIEPPKERMEIGINKTGAKETEKFLRPPIEEVIPTSQGKWILILLSVAFVISAFSVFMLTYNLQGKELPQINKFFSALGSILPIGREESNKIESEINSVIQSAQQTKKETEALIRGESKQIESEINSIIQPPPKTEEGAEVLIKEESKQTESETLPSIQPAPKTKEDINALMKNKKLEEFMKNRPRQK